MGPCLAKPAASAVSPEKPADASPAPANGDAPPKRQRRPSRTAIENNIDLNDEEQLDRVMMQIMEDPADLADFQAFALDKSSEEEIDLWTDIDEYVKQFAICDDDEGDTDEEKLTRRLEVERMLEKHFCDGGPATKLNIPPDLIVDLRKLFDEKNYHTTIWFPLRTALVHDTTQLKLGSCASVDDIAVRVITRVVGHYKRSNILLIDAGWTGLSAQGKECGYGAIPKHPELAIVTLKQECGEITTRDGSPLNFESYPIGTILEVAPHHSCAATHQHAECHVVRDEFSGLILDSWPICKGW